jgi:hypothetical protein
MNIREENLVYIIIEHHKNKINDFHFFEDNHFDEYHFFTTKLVEENADFSLKKTTMTEILRVYCKSIEQEGFK